MLVIRSGLEWWRVCERYCGIVCEYSFSGCILFVSLCVWRVYLFAVSCLSQVVVLQKW